MLICVDNEVTLEVVVLICVDNEAILEFSVIILFCKLSMFVFVLETTVDNEPTLVIVVLRLVIVLVNLVSVDIRLFVT